MAFLDQSKSHDANAQHTRHHLPEFKAGTMTKVGTLSAPQNHASQNPKAPHVPAKPPTFATPMPVKVSGVGF